MRYGLFFGLIKKIPETRESCVILYGKVFRTVLCKLFLCHVTSQTKIFDYRTNPAVFLGGGSLLLKQQIEKSSDFKYIEFIEDIQANAVGYEKMTALHIQKRQGV